jgi:hypothetical protein
MRPLIRLLVMLGRLAVLLIASYLILLIVYAPIQLNEPAGMMALLAVLTLALVVLFTIRPWIRIGLSKMRGASSGGAQ